MDIIKAFQKNEIGINITIKGTYEEPLFRASDIGDVLEIAKIRNTIQDFDSTEKVAHTVGTLGGNQEVNFLTEKGLYQVLFTSRKPIAKTFKNWVCDVIKEIRINGKYDLEEQLKLKDQEIDGIKLGNHDNMIMNFENLYAVYAILVEKGIIKFGHCKDIRTRLGNHRNEFGKDIRLMFIFETSYNREFEEMIKKDNIIKPHIFSKTYKTNQTELIQLGDTFTIGDLNSRFNELKKKVSGELVSNLTKERDEIQLSKLEFEKEALELREKLVISEKENERLTSREKILVKKGYVEKTIDNFTCSRCGKIKESEEFNINKVSNRPKSVCKICEEIRLEEYEEQNKERIELENKERIEKEDNLKTMRETILESEQSVKCTRCSLMVSPKEMGINVRSNELYKICKVCRDKQSPKTKVNVSGELPKEGETSCGKCTHNFPTELDKNSRMNYKLCEDCREKDRLLRIKKKESLSNVVVGLSKCIYCPNEFEPELTKKKDAYVKSCKDCREKRKGYDAKRDKEKRNADKKEYYEDNKELIREKQKEYYDENSIEIIKKKKEKNNATYDD
jgi:prophage antirepressor-like protein